eukprot:s6893_g2.t1
MLLMMLVMMKEMKEEVDVVTLMLIDAAHDDEKEYDDGHLLIQLKAFSQAVHPSILQDMGMLAVCRKVWATEGIRGFFRGVVPPLMGSSVYRSSQFAVFEAAVLKMEDMGFSAEDSVWKAEACPSICASLRMALVMGVAVLPGTLVNLSTALHLLGEQPFKTWPTDLQWAHILSEGFSDGYIMLLPELGPLNVTLESPRSSASRQFRRKTLHASLSWLMPKSSSRSSIALAPAICLRSGGGSWKAVGLYRLDRACDKAPAPILRRDVLLNLCAVGTATGLWATPRGSRKAPLYRIRPEDL